MGTVPAGPVRPATLTPAPARPAAAAARPHAPEPQPPRRRASSAPPHAAALGARVTAPAAPRRRARRGLRTCRQPRAARRPQLSLFSALRFPQTYPVTTGAIFHKLSPKLQPSRDSPDAFPGPSPPPLPFFLTPDSNQPPCSFPPRSRCEQPDASRRPRSRGSCPLPSLETYPSDGACARGSSPGEPSVWSMGSAPVIRVLSRALRDVRGD